MATSRPRLSSTTPMPRLASSKMLILASSNAAMWGRRLRTDRNASHRGARGIAPETEPETNRYARVHSQIDCRVDTVTTNLYLSPGTHVALSVAFPTTKPSLITSWRTDKSDHVVGNSVQHRSAPAV